jgi:hypothetical protein
MQVIMPLPRFVRRILARRVVLNSMQYDKLLIQAAKMAGEEYLAAVGSE